MKTSSIKGILWLFISKLFPPIINFGVFAYTARILAPEDFGVVALALSIIFIIASFMPSGWTGALIKFQSTEKIEISSVLWLHLFVSLLLSILIISFATISFFDFQSEIFNLALMILSIRLIFDGLFHTLNAVLLKQQLYSLIALRTVFSTFISAVIIVLLISLDYGVWALVWSQVILSIANFVAVLIPTRKFVIFSFSMNAIKKMNSFAIYTTLSDGIGTILTQYDSVIIGGILGTRELGFYNVAKRLNRIINDVLIGTVNEVSLPLLASQQNNEVEFRNSFVSTAYLSTLFLFPIFTFLFLIAEDLLIFLFTEKWVASAVVFQAFCIMFFFILLGTLQKNIIILTNQAKWWFQLQLKLSIIIIPITSFSAYWGVEILLLSLVLSKILYFTCSTWKSCDLLSISIRDYLLSFFKPVFACFFSGLILFYLLPFIASSSILFFNLIISCVVYFSIYISLVIILDANKIITMATKLFPKNKYILILHKIEFLKKTKML
jgi:teichuronic acid exporter